MGGRMGGDGGGWAQGQLMVAHAKLGAGPDLDEPTLFSR